MSEKRQCYWLQELEPSSSHPDRYRVCVVTEGEPGYHKTGGGDVEPWYWNQATCDAKNKSFFGLSKEDAMRIVGSSMFCDA
ncbi:hypothetical protein LCGC14_0249650 [marine sediment metagenome]|uniref:Uncharacterized protein n=1 Tax=marine sediment metagenome TaxID=412755 RepID=A0A0F9ULS0_9ZZZZ